MPKYRPVVSGFLWHTADAINWIKVYRPLQAELFTTSSFLLPVIIKQNESSKVTYATVKRAKKTWNLFCSLRKNPTFRDATTHSVFSRKMPSKIRAKKFRTSDASPPRSGKCFFLVAANFPREKTNQKVYSDLRRDVSSLWNFCISSSDVIPRGNQWWRRGIWKTNEKRYCAIFRPRVKPVLQQIGLLQVAKNYFRNLQQNLHMLRLVPTQEIEVIPLLICCSTDLSSRCSTVIKNRNRNQKLKLVSTLHKAPE